MEQKKETRGLVRRDFLGWLCKMGGGATAFTLASGAVPLRKVNTTLFGTAAQAQVACGEDVCTSSDVCESGDSGHVCQVRDVCDADGSGDCTNDECVSDTSGTCQEDVCVSDKSGNCESDRCLADSSADCVNDGGPACPEDASCAEDIVGCRNDFSGSCQSDSSKGCENDSCSSDSSGECQGDICGSDSSKNCETDYCYADSSGMCGKDECVADSAGECTDDSCVSDKSGDCGDDRCSTDSSGGCANDKCQSDSSKSCLIDSCSSDSSGECETDRCVSDSSGIGFKDSCAADSSGSCSVSDICVADSSGDCDTDSCTEDKSGECGVDRGVRDSSGACALVDVCVRDFSSGCSNDICRDDRTPLGSECATDTCALDLAFDSKTTRRKFARAGINKAIKLLYRIACVVLFIGIAYGQSQAQTVVDARDAVFYPTPAYVTSGEVTVSNPVGPFLRDCDGDGVLEADVNGDGLCDGDPEVRDYNGDSTRELPEGTTFAGSFEFTCFHIPDDVAIIATGPLTVAASQELTVLGTIRFPDGARFEAVTAIDLRTSAWLSDAGEGGSGITFVTARSGTVDETAGVFFDESGALQPINYTSVCQAAATTATPIPALNRWGAALMALLLVLVASKTMNTRRGTGAWSRLIDRIPRPDTRRTHGTGKENAGVGQT